MTASIIGSFIGTTLSILIVIGGCYLFDNWHQEKRKEQFKR